MGACCTAMGGRCTASGAGCTVMGGRCTALGAAGTGGYCGVCSESLPISKGTLKKGTAKYIPALVSPQIQVIGDRDYM